LQFGNTILHAPQMLNSASKAVG